MTELLTSHGALLTDAPDGIQKVRRLVRQLAVMGKLTGKGGATRFGGEWRRTKFGEVFSLEYGENLPAPKRTGTGEFPVYGSNGVVGSHAEACVHAPCLVVGRKGSAGAVNVCEHRGSWVTDVAYYCVPPDDITLRYSHLLFLTLGLDELGKGIKPGLSRSEVYALPISLPPLAEQHSIVAKVDELMTVCDRLEALQQNAHATHTRLVHALLHSFSKAGTSDEMKVCWERLASQFSAVFTTLSSVDELKALIVQLAVAGVLVRDDSGLGGYPTMSLSDVADQIVDCPHSTPKWTENGEVCVRTSQFKPGLLDLSASRFVSRETYNERTARLEPQGGDVLYSREGGILGVACRIPLGARLCLGQRMMLIRPGPMVDGAFLELVLNSPQINELARVHTTGGAAPRINVSTVRSFPIPVPPLAVQRRILAKVAELCTVCDQLKARIAVARAKHVQLAEALVEAAVA